MNLLRSWGKMPHKCCNSYEGISTIHPFRVLLVPQETEREREGERERGREGERERERERERARARVREGERERALLNRNPETLNSKP